MTKFLALLVLCPTVAFGAYTQSESAATVAPPIGTSFVPATRGQFNIPAPYNTTAYRITQPSDCEGNNCVQYVGYSYWASMNNSAGSTTMYILVGLNINKGGSGPTIYALNKSTGVITLVGPIWSSNSAMAYHDTSQMYFSYGHTDGLYYMRTTRELDRINILTKTNTVIFNLAHWANAPGSHIKQCSSSYNDQVHACTLQNSSWQPLGCMVYNSASDLFRFFPASVTGGFDECHVGAGGHYLIIDEKTPQTCPKCDEDTVLVNLLTGRQTIINNKNGGGGHYATGYGYYIQAMNWNASANQALMWNGLTAAKIGQVFSEPWSVECSRGCGGGPHHISWLNAQPVSKAPLDRQYACDSTMDSVSAPFSNQVYCFLLDSSAQAVVIAPTMIGASNTGCGPSSYANQPKGNIDYTGHYFMWSSNLGTDGTCQIFIAKIPVSEFRASKTPTTMTK